MTRVRGGCFGIRFVAGVVKISYKSKNFFAEYKQPPGIRRRSACGRRCGRCGRGAPRRVSGGCVLFHGERVARGLGLALGARVRVGGGVGKRRETETPRAAPLWVPAFAGMTRAGVRGNDGGCVRGDALARGVGVRWGPPSCALRTSFDRLRANGLVERLRRGGGVLGGIRVYEGVRAVELSRRGRGAGHGQHRSDTSRGDCGRDVPEADLQRGAGHGLRSGGVRLLGGGWQRYGSRAE